MKKLTFKSITLALTLMLAACGSYKDTKMSGSSEPEYKISDTDVKKWVIEKNKVEQCLFPKKGSAKNRLSESNRFVYQMAAYNRTLSQIIGEDHYQTLMQDPASQQYLADRLAKLGHSKSVKIEKKWCSELIIKNLINRQKRQSRLQRNRQRTDSLSKRKKTLVRNRRKWQEKA